MPVLVLHPEDDQIIPVEHARMLAEAATATSWCASGSCPGGGHGAIDAVDREWFYAVARGFFERWAGYGGRDDAAGDGLARGPVAAKLIYSAAR